MSKWSTVLGGAIYIPTGSQTSSIDGYATIYAKSDGNVYLKNTSGTEAQVGGNIGGGGGITSSIDIQIFTSNGTWTKPAGAKFVRMYLTGAGAGGSGGARYGAGTGSSGGAGGGSGGVYGGDFLGSALPNTLGVVVGAGGLGGQGATSDSTNGLSGTDGGETYIQSGSSVIARASSGPSGSGTGQSSTRGPYSTLNTGVPTATMGHLTKSSYFGTPVWWASNNAGVSFFVGVGQGGNATSLQSMTDNYVFHILQGGAAGNGITSANVTQTGGVSPNLLNTSGTSVLIPSHSTKSAGSGLNGDDGITVYQDGMSEFSNWIFRSQGGGGGSASDTGGTVAAGNGGVGGLSSGGGGGGGARNGANGGNGGRGGDGYVVIITWI